MAVQDNEFKGLTPHYFGGKRRSNDAIPLILLDEKISFSFHRTVVTIDTVSLPEKVVENGSSSLFCVVGNFALLETCVWCDELDVLVEPRETCMETNGVL